MRLRGWHFIGLDLSETIEREPPHLGDWLPTLADEGLCALSWLLWKHAEFDRLFPLTDETP